MERVTDEASLADFIFFFFTLVTGPRRFVRRELIDTQVYAP